VKRAMNKILSQSEIREWFAVHRALQKRRAVSISVSQIAEMAGMSRQTLYALLRGDRTEFGEVAQIRISRVIAQISADPNYQHTRMFRVRLSSVGPRLHFFTS
jgi:DNA-binding phage protein